MIHPGKMIHSLLQTLLQVSTCRFHGPTLYVQVDIQKSFHMPDLRIMISQNAFIKSDFLFTSIVVFSVYHHEIDRLGIENWLLNQERRAATRKVAVNLGYAELELQFGFVKRWVFSTVNFFQAFQLNLMKVCPNQKFFDPLYFKWLSIIQAARIYKGYTSK